MLDIDSVHWKLVQEQGGYRIVPSDDAVMTRADMLAMMERMVLCMNKLRTIETADLERMRSMAFSRFVAEKILESAR